MDEPSLFIPPRPLTEEQNSLCSYRGEHSSEWIIIFFFIISHPILAMIINPTYLFMYQSINAAECSDVTLKGLL